MHQKQANTLTIQRLTALWALGESGLGGFMHALKLPFTGIFVGGFAVIIIALLAHFSYNNYRQMVQATLLVLLVKFAVSPQSPPQAYLAVGFQGFIGAVIYRLIPSFSIASVLFGIIAMLESAFQKLVVMTLIYGKSLWEGLDTLYKGAADNLFVPQRGFSFWLIAAYVGIYFVWGIVLGIYIIYLPKKIEKRSTLIAGQLHEFAPGRLDTLPVKKKSKYRKLLNYLLVLALLVVVFVFDKSLNKAAYLIIRTLTVLLLFYMVINPIIKWWMQKQLANASSKKQEAISGILNLMPELRSFLSPAYILAGREHKNWKKYPAFVTNLIIITLNPPGKNEPE